MIKSETLSFDNKRPPLSHYLTFISVETISMLGSNIVDFVLIWWIVVTTKSALYLSIASLIVFGTRIFLSPVAGVFIDRWNRKIVIILSDFGQAISMFYLIYKFTFGTASVNDILLIMFIGSLFASFQSPAFSAIVPVMVEEKNIERVNSLSYFARIFTSIIGAPIGALLYSIAPISTLLWIDIISFFFAVVVVSFIRIPSQKETNIKKSVQKSSQKGFIKEFKEGLSIIKSKGLVSFLIVFTIDNFFETPRNILLPLLISDTYQGNAFTYALIISSFQVSVSLTAILMGWKNIWRNVDPAKVFSFSIIGIFIGSILLVIPSPGSLGIYIIIPIIGMILIGICSPSVNVTMQSLEHKIVPPDKQGRVNATNNSISLTMIPPATLITGFLIDFLGNEFIRFIIFISCIFGIISMILIWYLTDLSSISSQIVHISEDKETLMDYNSKDEALLSSA